MKCSDCDYYRGGECCWPALGFFGKRVLPDVESQCDVFKERKGLKEGGE